MCAYRTDPYKRVLRTGESLRSDGRYVFTYKDRLGKPHTVYSWTLEPDDPTPLGRKAGPSLREKELEIHMNGLDGIALYGEKLTVLDLVSKYIAQKTGVKDSTKAGYKTVLNILKKEKFGKLRIDKVKTSDAKIWLIKLQTEDHRSYSAIHSIRGVLRPAFQLAVDDDLLRKNPFNFELKTVIYNDSVTREALTRKQQEAFLNFVKNDRLYCKYYEAIYILFNTGMRISEFTGLTLSDLDFKNRLINIDHQLMRTSSMKYIIETPKSTAGVRKLPMTEGVYECFQQIVAKRPQLKKEPCIDGYSGFLYFDKDGKPMVALHWEKYFQHIREKYNRIYKEEMPLVTPHICRHTYCSNMAKTGINPKTLQYLMGHSDICVTLNTYTHLYVNDAQEELERVMAEVNSIENGVANCSYTEPQNNLIVLDGHRKPRKKRSDLMGKSAIESQQPEMHKIVKYLIIYYFPRENYGKTG